LICVGSSAVASVVVSAPTPAELMAPTWVELSDWRSVVDRPLMVVVDNSDICCGESREINIGTILVFDLRHGTHVPGRAERFAHAQYFGDPL
jgi:hypothetical protein